MPSSIKVSSIFVPGGFPNETYIPRDEHNLETRVAATNDNLAKLVVVTGMTKSGKTVLVDRIFPRGDGNIWIDGGSISDEQSFWEIVNDELDIYTQVEYHENHSSSASVEGTVSVEGNILLAKGSSELKGGFEGGKDKGYSYSRQVNPKVTAIRALTNEKYPIIIDDFHYIDKAVQKSIVRALKSPIMRGAPVIFIAIPNRKYDAVEVEREMTGRIDNIEMPVWTEDELTQIAKQGFAALKVVVKDEIIKDLACAAYGSPFLMQEFCRELCKRSGITESKFLWQHIASDINLNEIYTSIAEHSGRSMFEKLKRGPRARSDRKDRVLIDGTVTDIYGVVMETLKHLQPGTESITYEQLRTSMRAIIRDELPQKNEISRVLDKIAEISYTDSSSTPVIDWQSDSGLLTITDPFFAFFLKWSS